MSIGFVKRVWILRVCLIQVFLVEIVRKSAGFLTAEDILDIENWNYVRKGREDATEQLRSSPSLLPVTELGQKMVGVHSFVSQYVYKGPARSPGIVAGPEEEFIKKFICPLRSCMSELTSLKISRESRDEITGSIISIKNHMNHITSHVSMDSVSKTSSEFTAAASYNVDFNHEKKMKDFNMARDLQSAWNLLKNEIPPNLNESDQVIKIYSIMFRLSDIVLEFFLDWQKSENYWVTRTYLIETFSGEVGAQMIVNYVWGKFPIKKSIASTYANFDFQQSLESSPFLQELAMILKYVNKYVDEEKERRRVKGNWGFQRISRLYLALQVKSLKNSCGKYIFDPEGMDHQFFEITSPEYLRKNSALSFDIDIGKLLKDLVTVMLSQNIKQDEKMEVGILKLKIYHNMLRFLVEYHIKDVSYRNLSMIKGESFYPQIEALDAAIMFFSQSINSFSAKFGEIAQELALGEYNSKELKEGSKDFIFLADNRRKTYVPLLGVDSKRPNQIYHGKKVKCQGDQKPKDRVNDLIESWKDVGYTKYSQMILNEYLERCGSKTHFTTQSIVKWNQDLSNNFFKDILPHEKYDLPRLFDYTKKMTKDHMDSISSLQLETDFSK